jgi:2,3-bisphosphoglycerate-independent phosphoglycerate mutase
MDNLLKNYPNACLRTSGEDVGLPEGQMGNSEVGHLNLGAGRVVYQDFARINKEVREGTIETNPVFKKAFEHALKSNSALHLLGLVSDGGVHSHQNHLHKLCDMANAAGLKEIYIHAFTDGRDTDPKGGLGYINKLQEHIKNTRTKIASIVGRYYAMDRDKRWERVKKAYDLMVHGKGTSFTNPVTAIQESYNNNVTDEFIEPLIFHEDGKPVGVIKPNDVVICFNFRTDRCREITEVLTQKDMPEFDMKILNLYYVTMTNYDDSYKNIHIAYNKDNLSNTLGEVIERANKKQIRIAETEKYPHVTFFFSGGREKEFNGEKRILVQSPKVATYDLKPEMSAQEVTELIIPEIAKGETDFICLNFANADMVGHTGVFDAVVKAVETVDSCLDKIVNAGIKNNYSFIIIADHGNADYMVNSDGTPNTAHTTNLVPCVLIDSTYKNIKDGKLGDIAPTILKLMDIETPPEMTGEVLI